MSVSSTTIPPSTSQLAKRHAGVGPHGVYYLLVWNAVASRLARAR